MFRTAPNNSSLNESENGETGEHLACPINDLFEEMQILKRAGIGISDEETMKIWVSMRILVEKYC